jgi:hypothetical protein
MEFDSIYIDRAYLNSLYIADIDIRKKVHTIKI